MSLLTIEAQAAKSAKSANADRILAQEAMEAVDVARDVVEDARDVTLSARDEALNYGSARLFSSWTEASVATFTAGEYVMVVSTDTGTHTDPVVGGTVNNAGVFRYSSSPAGLERVGNLQGQIAQAWAEGTEPGGPGTKSAKGLAAEAAASAASLNDRISLVDFLREDRLLVFQDADGGVFGEVALDGVWDIALAALETGDFQITWEERIGYDWPIVILDGAGKLLWNAPAPSAISLDEEIAAARGDQAALNDRLSAALDDYGLRREQVSFRHNLRQTLAYFGNAAMGVSGQFRISAIGDSWTRTNDRWVQRFVEYLEGEIGLAAPGWVGFGRTISGDAASANGSWNWTDYPLTRAGTWTDAYNTSPASPDRSHATSTEVGASQSVSGTATPVLSGADLYWIGTADGVVEYRWNGTGAWNSLNVQGLLDTVSWAAITTGMLVSGAWSVEVRVVSGTVKLCGIEFKGAGNGVHFNKFGGAGASIANWATAGNYGDAYGRMNPNLFIIMDGTNSQPSITPASWGTQMENLIDGIRADCPLADILIMMPSENLRTNAVPMSAFSDEGRRVAYEKGCGFLDHCFTFGADTSVYGASGLKWFDTDPIHCTTAGYRALTSATLRTLGAL